MPDICQCPDLNGLNYEEALIASGLLGRKEDSKNCCESGGYICPNLSSTLTKIKNKYQYTPKKRENASNDHLPTQSKRRSKKVLRKRRLTLQ